MGAKQKQPAPPPPMKAKCPHCSGTGEIEVTIATGNMFTRECLNEECGFENGSRITDLPVPSGLSGPCAMCGGETRWKVVDCDEISPNRPE